MANKSDVAIKVDAFHVTETGQTWHANPGSAEHSRLVKMCREGDAVWTESNYCAPKGVPKATGPYAAGANRRAAA